MGFDLLGLAIEGPGDRCTASRAARPGVTIDAIRGLPCAVPGDSNRNTAGRAAASLLEAVDAPFGVTLELEKGIPIGSGMGGSAASAVAAVVAVNALLDNPLEYNALLAHALAGEALASSGRAHADNIAPSLFGGLTLVDNRESVRAISIPVPQGLVSVLVHPHAQIETREGRAVLARDVPFEAAVDQLAALGNFLVACFTGDTAAAAGSVRDVLVEPQRAHLVPGFHSVKAAALDSGAQACSISGSGPSIFALCDPGDAGSVATAMRAAFAGSGFGSDAWISSLNSPGAIIES